jgi:DNA uptake protein ComE-like DNA-binding protein
MDDLARGHSAKAAGITPQLFESNFRRFLMLRRIVAAVFVFALAFTVSVSAAQVREMKKTSPVPLNSSSRAPANAVDINTATETDLVAIGIDRPVAKKIIDSRPFRNKRDLVTKQLLTADQYDKLKDKIVARRAKKNKGGE